MGKVHEARQALEKLKKDYIATYIGAAHQSQAWRFGRQKQGRADQGSRLAALTRLATIELMPSGQLTEFQERLGALKSCYQLSEGELAGTPICPHCHFKPVNESLVFASAANQLVELDQQLDNLLSAWTQTLLDNLDDPVIQANMELLKAADRVQIQAFIAGKALPEPLSSEFITAVQEALSGSDQRDRQIVRCAVSSLGRRIPGDAR